jgi:hypothetical protein
VSGLYLAIIMVWMWAVLVFIYGTIIVGFGLLVAFWIMA